MNSDHRDNIGTHPAYSQDEETRLRARFDAAVRAEARAQLARAEAGRILDAFLARQKES